MRVIECPTVLEEEDTHIDDIRIFLGGGISNCGNWQREMIQRFKSFDDSLILINPRRADFDITNPDMSSEQIEWEYDHLHRSSAVLFWFPYETLCPITLYELGVHAAAGTKIFVGCHPGYQRKFDVEKQLSLVRPDVAVHDNFADLVSDISDWLALQVDRREH